MLLPLHSKAVDEVIEQNTEPFTDESGLETRVLSASEAKLNAALLGDADYIIEDEYGRIWSNEFFRSRAGLLAGPPHPAMVPLANYGYLSVPFRKVPRRLVTTREELYASLAALTSAARRLYPKRVVVYRGQTQEYRIVRGRDEAELLFGSSDVQEPSLRPSSARRAEVSANASVVWTHLVQRHLAHTGSYEPAHRFPETGKVWPHATQLGRLLTLAFAQHYGLPTPALDVTSDVGVALWFALHTIHGTGGNTLTAVPASGAQGVVYVIAGDSTQYFDEHLTGQGALRPQRQRGGFLASNWGNSKNRVARYLVGAVYFPHTLLDEIEHELPAVEYLFPGPREDRFVQAVQQVAWRYRQSSPSLAEIAEHVYWVESPPMTSAAENVLPRQETITIGDSADGRTDEELCRAAEDGDAEAGYRLGMRQFSAGNLASAEGWWRKAALLDHLDSACLLGWLLRRRGDPEGEKWTMSAATKGQPNAMNNLGLIYADRGDINEAERWYEQAAKAGVVEAAFNLGALLARTGRRREAERWLLVAADAGDPDAACDLGKLLYDRDDLRGAEHWFLIAAQRGQAQAAYNLGVLYESAGRAAEAAEWFRTAAAAGDPDAPYRLGKEARRRS